MSDDFGTVNVTRGERAREIEVLRAHYRRHREMLEKLIADAPTEHLATEYRALIHDIDSSLVKLDEIEGRGSGTLPVPPPRAKTDAGTRPLVTTPAADDAETYDYTQSDSDSRSRLFLIVGAALVALAAIGWLIWRASSDRSKPGTVVEQTTDTVATTIAEDTGGTIAPATPPSSLAVAPAGIDFGTILKGTRATRQVEVSNNGDQPVTIEVARSACRCLYYEYNGLIPPKAKETVTMTVDGAKAKAGPLRESIKISAKSDPTIATTVDLTATIR